MVVHDPKSIIGDRSDPDFDPAAPWGGEFRIDGMTRSMFTAAAAIIDTYGPADAEWSLIHCRDGHAGPGVYLCREDEAGSFFIGRSECERDDWMQAKAVARGGAKA